MLLEDREVNKGEIVEIAVISSERLCDTSIKLEHLDMNNLCNKRLVCY